jgi:hypothetical protein
MYLIQYKIPLNVYMDWLVSKSYRKKLIHDHELFKITAGEKHLPPSSADVTESGSLNLPEPSGPHRPVMGLLYLLLVKHNLWMLQ